jgi:hypothetical protein
MLLKSIQIGFGQYFEDQGRDAQNNDESMNAFIALPGQNLEPIGNVPRPDGYVHGDHLQINQN